MRGKGFHAALLAAALGALTVTGCSAQAEAEPEPTSEAPTYATENQVASVIAEYESDWREVADEAGDCRFTWVLLEGTAEEIQGYTCYLNEQTAGVTAQIVIRDLGELDVPPSMTDLVDETTTLLDTIGSVDLASVCGDGTLPTGTDECNSALAGRFMQYSELTSLLDKWQPYL